MVAPSNPSETTKRALVVQPDSQMRNLIEEQLQNAGFWVDSVATPSEGQAAYAQQPLIFATVDGDAGVPEGLITWIRQTESGSGQQPYIVAVGDHSIPFLFPHHEQLWNELLTIPLTHAEVRTRVRVIEKQLRLKTVPPAQDALPERVPTQGPDDLALSAEMAASAASHFHPNPRLTQEYFYPGIDWSGSVGDRERTQALVDNLPVSMAMFDREMRYLVVNKGWIRDYGLEGVDLIGRSHYEVFPAIGTEWKVVFDLALRGETKSSPEDLWIRADGTQDWVSWEVKPWSDSENQIGGVTFTCQTIRHRDPAAPEERDLEPFGQSLMRGNLTPVLCLDLDGHIRQANQAASAFLDDPKMEIVGELYWEIFSLPEKRGEVRREFLNFSEQTRQSNFFMFPQNMADTVRLSSGRTATLVWSVSPRKDSTGGLAGVILVGVILDRNALRSPLDSPESNPEEVRDLSHYTDHPEEILERVSFGIILLDKERNTVYANPEHHRMLGYDVRDYKDIEDWIQAAAPNPEEPHSLLRNWREAVWQRQSVKTVTLRAKNKMLRDIEFRPRPTSEGGTILTIFDVTEKRRGEDLLRASEAKFRALFFHAGLPIVLQDAQGRFSSANPLFEQMINVTGSDLARYGMRDWVHPDDWPKVESSMEQLKAVPDSSSSALALRLFRHGGDYVRTHMTISRIVDQTGKLVFTAYLFQQGHMSVQQTEDGNHLIQVMRHRIRNDLQLICSLASIQLGVTAAPYSRQILRQTQERVQTVAHLYQLMGSTTALPSGISIGGFLTLQKNSLLRTYDAETNRLLIRLVCAEIILPPTQALLLGFAFTEILGEIFRDAIGRGQNGSVLVRVNASGNVVEFRIEDDGLEFPDTLWSANRETSVHELLQALAHQLQAELMVVSTPPCSIAMRFAMAPAVEGT